MSVRVLFFGATAEAAGTRELTVDPGETTAERLLEHIVAEHPRLASHKLLIAIDQQYAHRDAQINDGSEIAIFTAVSGG